MDSAWNRTTFLDLFSISVGTLDCIEKTREKMKNKRVTTLQESTHLHRHQYYTTNKNTQPQVVIQTAMNSLSNDRIFYLERVLEGRWYM